MRIGWNMTTTNIMENVGATGVMVYCTGSASLTNQQNVVTYTFMAGTATTNQYLASNGTLTFPPGITNLPVLFTTVEDSLIKTSQTLIVKLSSPVTPAQLMPGYTNLTIALQESKAGMAWSPTRS